MVTAPIVLILGVIAFFWLKSDGKKVYAMIFGVLFGLALASTAAGPPIASGFQSLMNTVIDAGSRAVG